MKVIHLERGKVNYIEVGDNSYFVLGDAGGNWHTLPAKCAHRGGPLHLGSADETGCFIVCPWHKNRSSMTRLRAEALPTVSTRGRVTVVTPDESPETPHYACLRKTLVDGKTVAAPAGRTE